MFLLNKAKVYNTIPTINLLKSKNITKTKLMYYCILLKHFKTEPEHLLYMIIIISRLTY